MEEIKVNTNCKIDTKHFSISRKDNLNVAINITSLKALSGEENGFINFTFGFNKDEDVMENHTLYELKNEWITNIDGYGWFKLRKFNEDNIFISKIKLLDYNDISFEILKNINNRIFKSKTYYMNNIYNFGYSNDVTKVVTNNNNNNFSGMCDTEYMDIANYNCDMNYLPYKLKNLDKDELYYDECIILIGIYDIDNNLIAISYVYNSHNSCYTHIVETNHNGNIEVLEYL